MKKAECWSGSIDPKNPKRRDPDGRDMTSMPDADEIYCLVRRIRNGDREAFVRISRLYQKKVFMLAYSFFRNREDAMDIVQETFLRLYKKAHMYQQGKNFQNWLLQIAKNLCIDAYRKNRYHSQTGMKDMNLDDMNLALPDHDGFIRSSEIRQIVSRCLDRLSERQRTVFVMKHFNQLDYREIAQVLDVALGTVKSLHFKAVHKMRILMNPYLGRQI